MRNDKIFYEDDYRNVLDLKVKNEGGFRGYRSQMARAAGCQPAYLSQVLARSVHLTLEQAAGLSDFWGFTELEADYFLTLTQLGRSGTESLRVKVLKRLKNLRAKSTASSDLKSDDKESRKANMTEDQAVKYYSSWVPSAVHMSLSLGENINVTKLSEKLRVREEVVHSALLNLEAAGVVTKEKNKYRVLTKYVHVSDSSLYSPMHHRNWREKSKDYFSHGLLNNNFHYTAVCSLDKNAFFEIRKILDETKVNAERSVFNSKESSIACLNIDLFEI